MKAQSESRILREVQETVLDLHNAGLIDKRRMGEFDVLRNLHVAEMSANDIQTLREREHVSQAVLAAVLNTSVSTVQKWEIGAKKPSGPSLKLLSLISRDGIESLL